MTTMRRRMWSVGLIAVLVVSAALVASVAQAQGGGKVSARAGRDRAGPPGGGRGGGWHGWRGWGGSHRWGGGLGLYYGGLYDLWDPWYYPGGLYLEVDHSHGRSAAAQAAYDLGRDDALNGRPRHYVKGETPGYRGKCRDDYNAGYARGLLEETQRQRDQKYQPPTHYEPPTAPGTPDTPPAEGVKP
ncbi:MAG: hypothetical protein FJX75_17675 [Armatimonadetes bacterium]|nr:hypothetical protein [Armatimonadota bacterium]